MASLAITLVQVLHFGIGYIMLKEKSAKIKHFYFSYI